MNRFIIPKIAVGLIAIAMGTGTALAHGHGQTTGSGIAGDGYFKSLPDGADPYGTIGTVQDPDDYPLWSMAPALPDTPVVVLPPSHVRARQVAIMVKGAGKPDFLALKANAPGYVGHLRRSIAEDHPVAAQLAARHVAIHDVVGAKVAGNGSVIFYVR